MSGKKVPLKAFRETIDLSAGQSFRLIRWARSLRSVESLLPDGTVVPVSGEGVHWHHHPEMELTLFTEGGGTRFVGDHIAPFPAGDLVLLGKNLPHYWHTHGDSAGVSIQWHFPPGHPLWTLPEMAAVHEAMGHAERGLRLDGGTAERVRELLHFMMTATSSSRMAKLLEILSLVTAMPESDASVLSSRTFVLAAGSRYQSAIDAVVRHLIANFREEIRLPALLRLSNMSRATFARQFKEHSGRTVSEFVNELRLQAACRQLLETDKGVLEIAMDCGFNQISFFNRLFRREKGCNPLAYRKAGGEVAI